MLRSDSLKESLFDTIGYSTLEWSEFLSGVVLETAFRLLPQIGPCVFDVFMPLDEARTRLPRHVEEVLEVHCSLPYDIAWTRFIERSRTHIRHRGHMDDDITLEHYRSTLEPQQVDEPFDIGSRRIVVDTMAVPDHAVVTEWLHTELGQLGWTPAAYQPTASPIHTSP